MNDFSMPRKNVYLILAGLVIMVLGYVLMMGGGSSDPQVFNEAMFSFRRIVLAPVVIVAGIVLVIVAIMRRPKDNRQ